MKDLLWFIIMFWKYVITSPPRSQGDKHKSKLYSSCGAFLMVCILNPQMSPNGKRGHSSIRTHDIFKDINQLLERMASKTGGKA